jgi:purine-cytosine permease-like protein
MRLGILKSWLVGLGFTLIMLALASSPLMVIVLSTVGLPYIALATMFGDVFFILGINGAFALHTVPLIATIACSLFYGALVYFAPFAAGSVRRRRTASRHT